MNRKWVMMASAITLGATGIGLTFAPQEISSLLGWRDESALVLQLLGALYFGFAMQNWMAKATLIGGIYNRPLATGNVIHFS